MHVQAKLEGKNIKGSEDFSKGRKRKRNPRGIDEPFPRQQLQFIPDAIAIEAPVAKRQCFMQRGTKLALKFPHLVQQESGT